MVYPICYSDVVERGIEQKVGSGGGSVLPCRKTAKRMLETEGF